MSDARAEVSPPPVVGMLDMLKLFTPDVAGALAFYRDVLGALVAEEDLPHWARVRLANVDIGLHLGEATEVARRVGWEPGFRVHDVAAFRAHLQRRGVNIVQDFHDIPGGVTVAFADPAGNVLSVVQYGTSVEALASEPS
jgi:predicted enzyme related to lactoylglutathione lyase